VEAEFADVEQKADATIVRVYSPPVSPVFRLETYVLVVLEELTSEELESDEERFSFFTEAGYQNFRERRSRNLPIYRFYQFMVEDKERLFRVAQKVGGRIQRKWGPYTEVITEFPGKAWDFSKYNVE